MYINDIFDSYPHTLFGENKNITNLAIHSSNVRENCLFFVHKGSKTNGAEYIYEAVSRGAVAVCAEDVSVVKKLDGIASVILVDDSRDAESYASSKFYYRADSPKIIGVTGTNGKTSVCHIARRVFEQLGKKCAYVGTLGSNLIDKAKISNTTLPPSIFHKLLCKACEDGYEYLFAEVSSQGIEQKRCNYIDYHALIFTNLTKDHLDAHGNMENYFRIKAGVFKANKCFYVINTDNAYGTRLYEDLSGVKFSLGTKNYCDIVISDFVQSSKGINFNLTLSYNEPIRINVGMYGLFNAYNIALVCGILHIEGFSPAEIAVAVNSALSSAVSGRMERFDFCGADVYVDYAHTPDALENILKTARDITKKDVITVFGCGGDRDKTKREEMGRIACRLSDIVIITQDNCRSESLSEIVSDILKGCEESLVTVIPSRRKAILSALSKASCGDCVIIAGRGAEEILDLGEEKIPFSDREFVRALCEGR